MGTVMVPASGAEALGMLESALGFLADADAVQLPAEAIAMWLRGLEQADAVGAAARARLLAAFDAKDGHLADGQRTTRAWLVHSLRVTGGQAGLYGAVQALAREHGPLLAGLRGQAVTASAALQLATWTRVIPAEFRAQAEEILIAAARAGADLRALAALCAEIRSRTAAPDPDGPDDPRLGRALSLDTTFDGAGVIRGDLTPDCAAMVTAVLDALSAAGRGTCAPGRSAATTRSRRRCVRCEFASCLTHGRRRGPPGSLVTVRAYLSVCLSGHVRVFTCRRARGVR